ncbi:hypothetical protein H0264_28480 [Nocardia huaxiensis]|uniref:Uncharacterized protein n=1 Tax=Nocardia huaxiensis TaxID=2755382 RepID=A0A7D6VBW6_9NOCA|nr:hypothetical protein [Nocardia huaxiensis]QLY29197.1 hypothetical protein H0264_28480 [Nocardia huaxiensis]
MTNRTPPPLAALHEPWGWIKKGLVLVFAVGLYGLLGVKEFLVLIGSGSWRKHR